MSTFFLVILVILLTAEPVRILKMEVPQVSNFESFTAEPLNFHYCWTFEILDLFVCLLLNLWTLFTAEPLRFLTALSVYCWTFELCLLLNLWDSYLFTAEPLNFVYCWTFEILDLSVYCWTFELCLLLNLWDSLPICLLLNLWNVLYWWTFEFLYLSVYCWTFETFFTAEPLRSQRFSSKQSSKVQQ